MYSEPEIERLTLLRDITQAGHAIGQVGSLPTEKLRKLISNDATPSHETKMTLGQKGMSASKQLLQECIEAIQKFDAERLEAVLNRGSMELGAQGLLQRLIAPLAQEIGELWRDGTITAAHEHFASAVIRIFLGHAAKTFASNSEGPVLIVATLSGQLHELGALLVSAVAANLGWQVTYLGASLPAAEIAGAAKQNRARAIALSLVYPEDDPRVEGELARLRELVPGETVLLAGGRAMNAYAQALENVGAIQVKDLSHFGALLDDLRKPAKKAPR
jgi:methanogenic corrinoid protein MtbC1